MSNIYRIAKSPLPLSIWNLSTARIKEPSEVSQLGPETRSKAAWKSAKPTNTKLAKLGELGYCTTCDLTRESPTRKIRVLRHTWGSHPDIFHEYIGSIISLHVQMSMSLALKTEFNKKNYRHTPRAYLSRSRKKQVALNAASLYLTARYQNTGAFRAVAAAVFRFNGGQGRSSKHPASSCQFHGEYAYTTRFPGRQLLIQRRISCGSSSIPGQP